MELFDAYDRHRNKTGNTIERGAFKDGCYFLVVHACVFNTKGEMLIQQRQPFKDGWANLWDLTMGGHAVAGETSQQAAQRELAEEIGLKLDFTDKRPNLTVNFDLGFDDYYLIDAEPDIDKLALQYEEVQRVKWASKEEILALIDSGEFIPYYKNLIELLFDMRGRFSARFNDDVT
jgi:isopentenyldiphosphate isomerase